MVKSKKERGKGARRKGHSFEREICGYLRLFNIDPTAQRKLEYQEGSSDIETKLPMVFQCRCQKSPSIWEAIKDAIEVKKRESKEFAVAPVRRTNVATIVAMPLMDFMKLLMKVYRNGKEKDFKEESTKK